MTMIEAARGGERAQRSCSHRDASAPRRRGKLSAARSAGAAVRCRAGRRCINGGLMTRGTLVPVAGSSRCSRSSSSAGCAIGAAQDRARHRAGRSDHRAAGAADSRRQRRAPRPLRRRAAAPVRIPYDDRVRRRGARRRRPGLRRQGRRRPLHRARNDGPGRHPRSHRSAVAVGDRDARRAPGAIARRTSSTAVIDPRRSGRRAVPWSSRGATRRSSAAGTRC